MASILDRARKDIQRILTDQSGFAIEVTFDDGNGNTATIAGIYSNHHINVNEENVPVNSKKATITVSEQALLDSSYPVRNNEGYVDLVNHKVDYKDSTGVTKKYLVGEQFPDETIGNIVLILNERDG